MSSRILLFGSSGYLGSNLKKDLKDYKIFSPSRSQLNLLNTDDCLKYIDTSSPDLVVYCAGITKIDFAEKNKSLTSKLNFEIPKNISKFTSQNKIKFIYISTDAVFDGYARKNEFTEDDKPFARSFYGKSKLNGENSVLENSPNNLILRSITFFGGKNKNNFANMMISNLKSSKEYLGIYDQIQNPLNIGIATKAIKFSIQNDLTGIYNLGSLDSESNYDFLVKLAIKNKLNSKLIKKISFEDFMKDKKGYRKKKSVLRVDKFNKRSHEKILKTIDQSIKISIL